MNGANMKLILDMFRTNNCSSSADLYKAAYDILPRNFMTSLVADTIYDRYRVSD